MKHGTNTTAILFPLTAYRSAQRPLRILVLLAFRIHRLRLRLQSNFYDRLPPPAVSLYPKISPSLKLLCRYLLYGVSIQRYLGMISQ